MESASSLRLKPPILATALCAVNYGYRLTATRLEFIGPKGKGRPGGWDRRC